ncbi:Dal3 protein [Candida orthopsilosis Co 90-125]|uniref:Ureidoglycolate lyase n=1 Tax=Candida orthopsilosis (strain 90-125) TaxID=1136231 RepID=H8X7H7_CANO9|nr:Dal3 protein [Candida orthopsilosis Co 90-125]CCG23761.1 Dal3 protein [Candida orthopsilosis Co 90-125]
MVLKTFKLDRKQHISATALTPEAFAPYGGVISADHQLQNVQKSEANYGTAIKLHKVAPIVNNFHNSTSGTKETANWNIFRCTAPKHLIKHGGSKSVYLSKVLERHPFSTQTFVPMGQDKSKLSYLVIVAKTNESTSQKLPDPSQIKAFICKGNQSITYGAGIWHAPMVVIDETITHLDFAVLIHENGVAEEDCQECYFDPGYNIEYTLESSKL